MAYLSPTRIPQDFLFALFNKDFPQESESIENALEILEDYSLISTVRSADSDSHSFSVHTMIQDTTIENLQTFEYLSNSQKPRSIFNGLTFLNETDVLLKLSTEAGNYIKTLDTRKILRGGEIVENLVYITNHVSKILDVKEFRDLTAKVAEVLRRTNDFAKSIELYETVVKATPASEVESEIHDNIELKWYLAYAYRDGGFQQKSIELLEEILEDETRTLGPHHKVTLAIKCDIATALRLMGKYNKAAKKFSSVLQDFRNINDTHSETFLITKSNYANLLRCQGKTEEALKLLTEVLEEDEKNPDLNPEQIVRTKGNIAYVLKEQGKLEESAAMMLKNISDSTRVFGPFDLNTFTFKRNYGQLLRVQGKHEEAAQLFLELLEIQETELGSKHPDTLRTKNNLAGVYIDTMEPDKALPLLDVKVRERVFGPEHPDTMDTANKLAIVMKEQGKFEEALSLHIKTLKLRKQVLGPNYPKSLTSMYNIGVVHYKMEELDKAAEVFQDLLPRRVEVLGKNHTETMKALEALTYCKKILDDQNNLIANFMRLTSVDAEIGRNLLEASNWNTKAALDTFLYFNSTEDEDIVDLEEPDDALIPSTTITDFRHQTLGATSSNTTQGNPIQDVEVQMETVSP